MTERLWVILCNIMYLSINWAALTESQIFSRPARPNLINKHFII